MTTLMTTSAPTRPANEEIMAWLRDIPDPEIPVLSIVDLGIIRQIAWKQQEDLCVVSVTPTYSACPAFAVIQQNILAALQAHGVRAHIQVLLSPPWTTDWMSPQAAEKLRHFHIAPPAPAQQEQMLPLFALPPQAPPQCPHCGSGHTTLLSQFGSALCRSLYRCEDFREPFDLFKSL